MCGSMEVSGGGVPTVTLWPQVEPHRGCHLGEDLTSVGTGWPQAQLQSHIATGHSQSYSYTLATGTVTVTPGNTLRQIQGPWRWLFSDTHVLCHPWLLTPMYTVTHVYCHPYLLSYISTITHGPGWSQTGTNCSNIGQIPDRDHLSTLTQIPDRDSILNSQSDTRQGIIAKLSAAYQTRTHSSTHCSNIGQISDRNSLPISQSDTREILNAKLLAWYLK